MVNFQPTGLLQKRWNPTNDSWWKFHFRPEPMAGMNNPPTLVGGISRSGSAVM
jgi:hypothetical protein